MWAVPSQEEVYFLARVLELCGEVDWYRESSITIACPMTDVPMGSHRGLAVADKTHGIHQTHVLTDG